MTSLVVHFCSAPLVCFVDALDKPGSNGDVTITLPATTDCDAQGAICADSDKKLSSRLERTVSGPG